MGSFKKRLLIFLGVLGAAIGLGWGLFALISTQISYSLPEAKLNFEKLKPTSSAPIFDHSGLVLAYKTQASRLQIYRPTNQISEHLRKFIVLSEDAKFFGHDGFDFEEIKNSVEQNIEQGKVKRGASTISQQLVKNLFLNKDRSIERKLFEIPWTMRLEIDLTKAQILELYLNVIEWGPGIFGVEAASRHFFDKSAENLTVGQALYLAMIVPNPVRFDLFAHPKAREFIEKKRKTFVDRLVDEKKIELEAADFYKSDPFGLVEPNTAQRSFAAQHLGSYFGGLGQIGQARRDLISEATKRGLSKSTLDLGWQTRIENDELEKISVADPNRSWAVVVKDGQIQALRRITSKNSLSADFLQQLSHEGLEADYRSKAPWNEILLAR